MGATVVGAASTLLHVVIGTIFGQSYNGTIIPLAIGFLIFSIAAQAVLKWIEGKQ